MLGQRFGRVDNYSLPVFRALPRQRLLYSGFFTTKRVIIMIALGFVAFFVGPAAAGPIIRAFHEIRQQSPSGVEILLMPFSFKMVETFLAILSVTLVTLVYSFLIQRGSLMSTTAMYPKRSIEANIGKLLSLGWPDSSSDATDISTSLQADTREKSGSGAKSTQRSNPDSIRLLYLGKMLTDSHTDRVAKGVLQCAATPVGSKHRSPLWLTSGSPLTKNIVQLLIWEWASLWLLIFMITATLMYNGFFINQLNLDSYPRLTVMLIYSSAFLVHVFYVWSVCSSFFTSVASGAAWSLLERARFAVGESKKLRRRAIGKHFEFRSIDKASSEYVPTTFSALFKHETQLAGLEEDVRPASIHEGNDDDDEEDPKDVRAALSTLDAAQKSERRVATDSVAKALDRVISNAMVMMGVTLSTGFSAWTSQQTTDNSPNNFNSTLIGSLALLASLSLGAATMFTSAMHLSIMNSSYRTIVSLKETKINGHAVEHYKKRRLREVPLSFSSGTVPESKVSFADIFATNRWRSFIGVMFFGPAFALLPEARHHHRTSEDIEFDLTVKVRGRDVMLTTGGTNQHARGRDGANVEVINVCYTGRYGEVLADSKG
jgi:hypothetical protein